jgi:putative flippase GtrA
MTVIHERRRKDIWGLLRRWTYVRYLGASALALAGDMACFLLLMASGFSAVAASAMGYILGLGVHWLISSRVVFAAQASRLAIIRNRQKVLFIGSALVGLGITVAIVGLGDMMHIDPRLAKLAAVAVAFQSTYLLRKKIVFGVA